MPGSQDLRRAPCFSISVAVVLITGRIRKCESVSGCPLAALKLPALHAYQLSLRAPKPPRGSFDEVAAARGKTLFSAKAQCASCHVPPLFTEPGNNLHSPSEIGIDAFQADRSPTHMYRTAPLALWTHQKPGFYHDGRFTSLGAVVEHYNTVKTLRLSEQEKTDLVEYLKSL